MIKTILLSDTEIRVDGLDGQHAHIRNFDSVSVYVSKTPGIVPDTDGVLRVAGGTNATLYNIDGTIYLTGSSGATVVVYTSDDVRSPFN